MKSDLRWLVPLVWNAYIQARKLFLKKIRADFDEAWDKRFPKMNRNIEVPISFLKLNPCKS